MRAAAAAVAVAVLTACGGLSREEFVAHADGICRDANRRVTALGPEPALLTPAQARWVERVATVDMRAVARVRKLATPSGDRERISRMVVAFERGFGRSGAIAHASRAGDDTAFRAAVFAALTDLGDAQLEARDYGLRACARLGRVGVRRF